MRCRLAQVACLAPVVLFGVLCSCDRLARLLQARGADGPQIKDAFTARLG